MEWHFLRVVDERTNVIIVITRRWPFSEFIINSRRFTLIPTFPYSTKRNTGKKTPSEELVVDVHRNKADLEPLFKNIPNEYCVRKNSLLEIKN